MAGIWILLDSQPMEKVPREEGSCGFCEAVLTSVTKAHLGIRRMASFFPRWFLADPSILYLGRDACAYGVYFWNSKKDRHFVCLMRTQEQNPGIKTLDLNTPIF